MPESPSPSLPLLPKAALLSAAVPTVLALGLAWRLHLSHSENTALRGEIASMVLARRAAGSRESFAADALRRTARLEQTLALMRRESGTAGPPSSQPEAGRAAELERVIVFLREEITAAQETIGRLKQGEAPRQTVRP